MVAGTFSYLLGSVAIRVEPEDWPVDCLNI